MPSGLDPKVLEKGRTLVIEADVSSLETMAKEGVVTGPAGTPWTLRCDEGKHVGGEDSAPAPLDYFTIGIAF
jgi:hypothetical protein